MRLLAAVLAVLLAGQGAAQPPAAGQAKKYRLRWGDLPPLAIGHTVALTLPDATRIGGTVLGFDAEAMQIEVRKTSNRYAWPKGRTSVPRAAIHELRLTRRTGAAWRFAGTAIGAAAGLVPGGAMAFYGSNEGGRTWVVAGVALIGAIATLGYLAGRSADHKTMSIEVEPAYTKDQ